MASITNKTTRPLTVSLPGGKTLRLGPLKTAEVLAKTLDHPPVKRLIAAGTVTVAGDDPKAQRAGGSGNQGPSSGGRGFGLGIRKTGDR